eukprot:5244070-Prymnesium_polylepis.1
MAHGRARGAKHANAHTAKATGHIRRPDAMATRTRHAGGSPARAAHPGCPGSNPPGMCSSACRETNAFTRGLPSAVVAHRKCTTAAFHARSTR